MTRINLEYQNPTFTVPTIDISPYRADPASTSALKVVEAVRTACTTFGFLQIVGHGIPRSLQDDVFRGAAAFFALPLEEKEKLDRRMPGSRGRGFEVMGTQEEHTGQSGDVKEAYFVSSDLPSTHPLVRAHPWFLGPNRWPLFSTLPYSIFKDPMDTYFAEMNKLVRTMFQIIASGLPYGPDIFDEFLSNEPFAVLKPVHYPPTTNPDLMGSREHTDVGGLTLLLQDDKPGLQVKYKGQWNFVPPNRDAYVVNVGDMLDRWTRGLYKSTLHRVVAQTGATHRYSLPFFFDGNLECRLVPFDGEREGEKIGTVEEHMFERFAGKEKETIGK